MYEARDHYHHEKCLIVKEKAAILDEYDIKIQYDHVNTLQLSNNYILTKFQIKYLFNFNEILNSILIQFQRNSILNTISNSTKS